MVDRVEQMMEILVVLDVLELVNKDSLKGVDVASLLGLYGCNFKPAPNLLD